MTTGTTTRSYSSRSRVLRIAANSQRAAGARTLARRLRLAVRGCHDRSRLSYVGFANAGSSLPAQALWRAHDSDPSNGCVRETPVM
jgi:hypothetical protein